MPGHDGATEVVAEREVARDELLPGVLLVLFLCALGLGAWWSLPIWGEAEPNRFYGHGIFYFLFARNEPTALLLSLGLVALLWWLAQGGRLASAARILDAEPRRFALAVTGGVFAVCLAGSFTVTQGFPLALDEYMPHFQAEIFRSGQLHAALPAEWRRLTNALAPIMAASDPVKGTWMSSYFPAYALLLAAIEPLGFAMMPAFAAGSVLLVGGCAQALWSDRRATHAAMLLLASCPQLLINAMTSYPLAGNLFFNLLWFRLLLAKPRGCALLLAPLSGFALLFHQPTPHALFVAPLGLGLLLRRKHPLWLLAWHATWAGLALWAFRAWQRVSQGVAPPSGIKFYGLPDAWAVLNQSINASLVATWVGTATLMLAPLAALRPKPGSDGDSAPTWLPELAAGVLLSFGFYVFFYSHQGHGWGYRYVFPAVGSAVLLAAAGYRQLERRRGASAALPVLAGALASLVLFLPLRSLQVASFIAPYAEADRAIAASGAQLALIDSGRSWYGGDLVRNDPFLRDPTKRALAEYVGKRELPVAPDQVLVLSAAALRERFGLLTRREAGDFTLRIRPPR